MNVNLPCLHIARLVLETRSPLSVASGRSSMRFDTMIVRDANGLPAVPGSSLAGVLRHLFASSHDEEAAAALFGCAGGEEGDQASRLQISWGCVHDSHDKPVEGLLLGEAGEKRLGDSLLLALQDEAPVLRRRVRMNDKGAADSDKKGLFDRSAVPAGTRFSFEILLYSDQQQDPQWENIRNLFSHPGLRLGGATRSGMGDVHCVRWHEQSFDFRQPEHYRAFATTLLPAMGEYAGMQSVDIRDDRALHGWSVFRFQLTPEAGWRIGGTATAPLGNRGEKEPDDVPHHEAVIGWKDGRAHIEPRMAVAPASSIKGALAHRIAFHANCLGGRWEDAAAVGEENENVRELFGFAADGGEGQAGKIFISDAYLRPEKLHWQMHNSLDRFTGGVRDKVLFGEEIIWGDGFDLTVWIENRELSEVSVQAMTMALADLCEGRLSLGSGMAKGHGWFTGKEMNDAA